MPYPDPSNAFLSDHTRLLRASYRRLTGRDLIDPDLNDREAARRLFEAPFALLSHNAEPDPILTYGNRRVLDLFELDWETLTRMPSRLTAGSGGARTPACAGDGPRLHRPLQRGARLIERSAISHRWGCRLEPDRSRGTASRTGRDLFTLAATRLIEAARPTALVHSTSFAQQPGRVEQGSGID